MNALQRYRVNPAVSCGDEEDGAVLFNPDTNETTVVNLTGRALWAFLEAAHTVAEMAEHLAETYQGVSTEKAAEDATGFVQALVPDFLVEVAADK